MAYARFGPDSAVYVYQDVRGGWTCCGCALLGGAVDFRALKSPTILKHLTEHRAVGQLVPIGVDDAIRKDAPEHEAWAKRHERVVGGRGER